jgi:hypothetical protein
VTPNVHTSKNQNKPRPHHYSNLEKEKCQNRGISIATSAGTKILAAALSFKVRLAAESINLRIFS